MDEASSRKTERQRHMTKIDIFSGFLGAGKTTLIKKLISEAYTGEQLVLIENEFGEIGIDGAFLQDAGIQITEMNSGCICCSLVGDFSKALEKVLTQFHPDRILIEPSGVGKLSDVKRAISSVLSQDVVLHAAVTVVDAKKAVVYAKNFGEFFDNQIEHANCVVLSRTQLASQEKIDACLSLVRAHNPHAAIVAAPWETLNGAELLAAMEQRDTLEASLKALQDETVCPVCGHVHDHEDEDEEEHEHHHHDHEDEDDEDEHEHHHHDHDDDEDEDEHEHHHDHDGCCHDEHHHHHHADEVFTSWGKETMHRYTRAGLDGCLKALSDEERFGTVLRCKGVVPAADGTWFHFDYVPGEDDLRTGTAGVIGRLCVIGSKLNEAALEALFSE